MYTSSCFPIPTVFFWECLKQVPPSTSFNHTWLLTKPRSHTENLGNLSWDDSYNHYPEDCPAELAGSTSASNGFLVLFGIYPKIKTPWIRWLILFGGGEWATSLVQKKTKLLGCWLSNDQNTHHESGGKVGKWSVMRYPFRTTPVYHLSPECYQPPEPQA